VGELNEFLGAAVAPRVSGRDHSGIRHVRHEASRGAPRPWAIGENKRAQPAFDHDPQEAECRKKEFVECYEHIHCVTTLRRRLSASEPPSRPFVVRGSTSVGTMLHDCASFLTRRVTTDVLSKLDE
jgi:hypothetical protein